MFDDDDEILPFVLLSALMFGLLHFLPTEAIHVHTLSRHDTDFPHQRNGIASIQRHESLSPNAFRFSDSWLTLSFF
jgi:hypothetical protein